MKLAFVLLLILIPFSHAEEPLLNRGTAVLRSFKSDGCTFAPDNSLMSSHPSLYKCCERHDVWYWMGGSWKERLYADRELASCIARYTTYPVAMVYYWAVRMAGGPDHNTSYRWSFGWSEMQRYVQLTPQETLLRDEHLKALQAKSIEGAP